MIGRFGRTRPTLIATGVLTAAVFTASSWASIAVLINTVGPRWDVLVLPALLVLVGHVLRVLRTKVPLDNARRGSFSHQFAATAVGYFYDTVLPLRLGELVRSFLIARRLRISFLYTLSAVLLERLIDVLLVAALALAVVSGVSPGAQSAVIAGALSAIAVAVAAIVLFVLLVRETRWVMRVVWRATSWLNPALESSVRFRIWTIIFGYQRLFGNATQVIVYSTISVLSWAAYLSATAVLATSFGVVGSERALSAVAPYQAVSTSFSWSDPTSYLSALGVLLSGDVAAFAAASWIVLTVPIAVIGLLALFVISTKPRVLSSVSTAVGRAVSAKLERTGQNNAFPLFLDSYFRGQRLSQVLHRLEVDGHLSLMRFFKGGSNAVAVLARRGNEVYVKKMVPSEYEHRLKNQYDWLVAHADEERIVTVLGEERTSEYYAIDLEYRESTLPLFDYVHDRSVGHAIARLDELWKYMFDRIYRLQPVEDHTSSVEEYIQERFIDRVFASGREFGPLGEAIDASIVVVNGRRLRGFSAVVEAIRATPQAWTDITHYAASTVIHGDLTVDNVLIDQVDDSVLIIDPSDDNQVRGPVIDFGRHMQSLEFGYEFLNEDESSCSTSRDESGNIVIAFPVKRSARYAELAQHMRSEIFPRYLSGGEQRAVIFHSGLFYGRMLTHRIAINPENSVKYFAVCLVALNDYLLQYEGVEGR